MNSIDFKFLIQLFLFAIAAAAAGAWLFTLLPGQFIYELVAVVIGATLGGM